MNKIEYINFNDLNPADFLPVMNDPALRKHLVDHARFDSVSIREWVNVKIQLESTSGCRVRAIFIGGVLAGWCGIQPDESGFEIAIVLSKRFWGAGISIFRTLLRWANELGHKEIAFHLLETRPEYRFLKRRAFKIQKSELLGRRFTTYFISVAES